MLREKNHKSHTRWADLGVSRTDGDGTGPWHNFAEKYLVQTEKLIASHPKLTLAAALSVGLAVGWIVKRK